MRHSDPEISDRPTVHAIIGVWHERDGKAYYVKRADTMENYPGVWSLFSERFDPLKYDWKTPDGVQKILDVMSVRRLGGVPIKMVRLLNSARNMSLPRMLVALHLFEITLEREPELNDEFYATGAWLTPDEFRERTAKARCGVCTQMWSKWCVKEGLVSAPFVASVPDDMDDDLDQTEGL